MADTELIDSIDGTHPVAIYQNLGDVSVEIGIGPHVLEILLTQDAAAKLADALTLARTCAAGWEAEQDA